MNLKADGTDMDQHLIFSAVMVIAAELRGIRRILETREFGPIGSRDRESITQEIDAAVAAAKELNQAVYDQLRAEVDDAVPDLDTEIAALHAMRPTADSETETD